MPVILNRYGDRGSHAIAVLLVVHEEITLDETYQAQT